MAKEEMTAESLMAQDVKQDNGEAGKKGEVRQSKYRQKQANN